MDLSALRAYLAGKGSPVTLVATDTGLPAELIGFLQTTPTQHITLTVQGGGIALDGQTLTIAGATTDAWPVQGLDALSVALTHLTLVLTNGATPAVACSATGMLQLTSTARASVALTSAVVDSTNAWQITLTADVAGVSPFDLLLLAWPGQPSPFPVPAGLEGLTAVATVPASGFGITFYPGTTYEAYATFTVSLPQAHWTLVPGVLALDGIDAVSVITTRSMSMTLTGHLIVGEVHMDVGVGMEPGRDWTAYIKPTDGGAFPGIVALANWIGSGALADSTTTGFATVGFDTGTFDAAIAAVEVGFNWGVPALNYVQITSLLTLGALQIDVVLRLPDVTLRGSLHGGPVLLTDVLAGFGLPTVGVPSGLSISQLDFAAQPVAGFYSIGLEVNEVWTAGPITLDEVSVAVAYFSALGFSGYVHATIGIGDALALQLTAEYDPTTGWTFVGATAPDTVIKVGDLIAMLADQFGISSVPAVISSLEVTELSLSYQTADGAFAFTCVGGLTVADTPVTLRADITVKPTASGDANDPDVVVGSAGYSASFAGSVSFAGLTFDLRFDIEDMTRLALVASYHQSDGAATVRPHDLVAAVSTTLAGAVPPDLEIELKDVKFAYLKQDATNVFVFGIDLGARVSLAELPLIGDKLPDDQTIAVADLQVLYSSSAVTKEEAAAVDPLLPAGVSRLPAAGLDGGVAIAATLQVGATTESIALAIGAQPPNGGADAALSADPPGAPPSAAGAYWVNVQKQFGVVQFKRVGMLYQDNALLFAVDAALAFGPLVLSVEGLGFGSPLSTFVPTFTITGLAIAYAASPVSIAGALLDLPKPQLPPGVDFQFDGYAAVEAEVFSLAALGSYAQGQAGPSLFVFAQLEAPLGGPPSFFVVGLMAGFGFNRGLTLPGLDEVEGFPLLALNRPAEPGTRPVPQDPMHVLDVLEGRAPITPGGPAKKWIAVAPGEYWLAVGVEFTSYEIVRTKALLVAEFGKDFQLALLGLSTIQLPQAAESALTYAYAELELEAVFKPQDGFFGLSAILGPASYVLTPACHLTGGFAFSLWFGDNPNAGQFVVTLGGYHPAFKLPSYFPKVPRLGFHWAVSGSVSISGQAYFALTTSCVMAGGGLAVLFHDGDLRAWFTAQLDVLISWRPFFFSARLSVSIGVSYRIDLLFCTTTISVSVGATVDMWGPPTGGRVHVDLWIVSFSVAFGSSDAGTADRPLDWDAFKSLLPSHDTAVNVLPVAGMFKTQDSSASSSGKRWVVRARDFRFATQSAVPASHLRYGEATVSAAPPAHDYDDDAVAIRPMNLTGVTGMHRLIVRHGAPTAPAVDVSAWVLSPRRSNVPASLWGEPPAQFSQIPAAPSADVVAGRIVGYDVRAAPPTIGASPGVVALEELLEEELPPGVSPLAPDAPASPDYVPAPSATTVADIAAIDAAKPARDALHAALLAAGAYAGPNDPLAGLAANAGHLFADAPMEVSAP